MVCADGGTSIVPDSKGCCRSSMPAQVFSFQDEGMRERMQTVLTLHGVSIFGKRGPWQKSVARVLGPHFRCVPITYDHYRWLGLFSAVMEPWVLLPGLGIILGLHFLGHLGRGWTMAGVVLILILSCVFAQIRHRRAFQNFLREIGRTTPTGMAPHIVAHSMGTKLVGTVLEIYPHIRFANVVFAGCVLPTNYPWKLVHCPHRPRFRSVRNEVGGRDVVPLLAEAAHRLWMLPGFGAAGRHGFEESDYVHTVDSLEPACKDCTPQKIAPVHNVVLTEYGHSSVFDTAAYASAYWLPFFWGIDPGEYADFLESCLAADIHHETQNWPAYRRAEEDLLDRPWEWTAGRSLGQYIEDLARAYNGGRATRFPVIGRVLRKVWQDVARACRADQERADGWERAIVFLHPPRVVANAVDAILRVNVGSSHR